MQVFIQMICGGSLTIDFEPANTSWQQFFEQVKEKYKKRRYNLFSEELSDDDLTKENLMIILAGKPLNEQIYQDGRENWNDVTIFHLRLVCAPKEISKIKIERPRLVWMIVKDQDNSLDTPYKINNYFTKATKNNMGYYYCENFTDALKYFKFRAKKNKENKRDQKNNSSYKKEEAYLVPAVISEEWEEQQHVGTCKTGNDDLGVPYKTLVPQERKLNRKIIPFGYIKANKTIEFVSLYDDLRLERYVENHAECKKIYNLYTKEKEKLTEEVFNSCFCAEEISFESNFLESANGEPLNISLKTYFKKCVVENIIDAAFGGYLQDVIDGFKEENIQEALRFFQDFFQYLEKELENGSINSESENVHDKTNDFLKNKKPSPFKEENFANILSSLTTIAGNYIFNDHVCEYVINNIKRFDEEFKSSKFDEGSRAGRVFQNIIKSYIFSGVEAYLLAGKKQGNSMGRDIITQLPRKTEESSQGKAQRDIKRKLSSKVGRLMPSIVLSICGFSMLAAALIATVFAICFWQHAIPLLALTGIFTVAMMAFFAIDFLLTRNQLGQSVYNVGSSFVVKITSSCLSLSCTNIVGRGQEMGNDEIFTSDREGVLRRS